MKKLLEKKLEGELQENTRGKWVKEKEAGTSKYTPHPTPECEINSTSSSKHERNLLVFSDNNSPERGEVIMKNVLSQECSSQALMAKQRRERERIQQDNINSSHARATGLFTPASNINTPLPQDMLTGFDEYAHENILGHVETIVTSDVDTTLPKEEEVCNDMQWIIERALICDENRKRDEEKENRIREAMIERDML